MHTGHDLSFVYDIADLYKAEVSIPTAFQIASELEADMDIESMTRRRIRDFIYQSKLMERVVRDIQFLLDITEEECFDIDQIYLWDDRGKLVKHGVSYTEVE